MGLKKFVKKNAPDWLFYLLRAGYRTVKFPYTLIQNGKRRRKINNIIERADKLLPYYRDELSRLILSDREKYLLTGDENIFTEQALKQGWTFCKIGPGNHVYIDTDKFSKILVIYDNEENSKLKYVRNLLYLSEWKNKYKLLHYDSFINNFIVRENELILPVMQEKILCEFLRCIYEKNLLFTNNIYSRRIISTREEVQYFDVFDPINNEIIIDAGCFDGATARQFLQWGGDKVKKIYSFECDPINMAKCEQNIKALGERVILIKKGTWDKDETLYINAAGTTGSSVLSEGNDKIYLTSIDSVVKDEQVTLIKMDIEGAELKSLIGAKNTIINNRPRLVICVYHKPEDICEIPEYILSLVPEYKFYLRHYSSNHLNTILYASCD